MNEAVITGYGVVSALGTNADMFATGLAESRCGVAPQAHIPGAPAVAAAVTRPLTLDRLEPSAALGEWYESRARRDRKVILALYAAHEAWRRAGAGVAERSAALCLGIGLEQAHLEDFSPLMSAQGLDWSGELARGPEAAVRFRSPLDLAAAGVSLMLGLTGPRFVHVSACAAGTMALGHAALLVRRGRADIVLAGATDSMLNPFGLVGMARLGAPSPRASADACRPFDRRRDGLAMGEGAAMFVVENAERACARGARVHARVIGYGATQDGYRVTAPRPDGARAAAAMRAALKDARRAPSAIDYLNAHGTGTPLNDVAEARAIRDVFAAHSNAMPVSSIKGAIGHAMAAAGALEAAACVVALTTGVVPGTVNCETPDPECPIRVLGPRALSLGPSVVMSSSFGFGGQNACIILEGGR